MVNIEITDPVVNDLTFGSPQGSSGTINAPTNMNWDCSIGDLTFLYGISDQYPFQRQTAEFRRQRIDTERNPGEQSLDSGYWVRSQQSWHYGSGLSVAEPLILSDEAQFRYNTGGGIDPWTPGRLTLLNTTTNVLSSAGSVQNCLGVGTGVLHSDDNVLKHVANNGTVTTITWGGTAPILSITSTGEYWLLADDDGIYKGDLPTGTGAKIYNTAGTADRNLVRWIKSRLMVANNNKIHEVTNIAPSSATLPAALYAHPNLDWIWTDFSDGPAAIYASGYSNDSSAIYRIGITTGTSTVTLSQPVIVAEMPRGEDVLSMYSYVGSYIIIGTTRGVRVASIDSDASISIGPLIETVAPVDDAVAVGSYVYFTVRDKGNAGDRETRAGLYRMDLGTSLDNNPLLYARAADLVVPAGVTGEAKTVTVSDSKIWFTVTGTGLFRQDTSHFVSDGWLETGRIRLGTMEQKAWRDMRLLLQPSDSGVEYHGTVEGYAATDDDAPPSGWTTIITADENRPDATGKLTSVSQEPTTNFYLAFRLVASDSDTNAPAMIGYQLRAVPAPERTRLLSVPLLCFDYETDRKGYKYGSDGNAWAKLGLLEDLEESVAVVQWRDYTTGEAATAYVERVEYRRVNPPTNRVSGNGGIATVLLRLV